MDSTAYLGSIVVPNFIHIYIYIYLDPPNIVSSYHSFKNQTRPTGPTGSTGNQEPVQFG